MNRSTLTSAILLSIALTACGGGGGNVKEDAPPPTSPPPTAPPPTNPPPTDTKRYTGIADNLLVSTNVDLARKRGYDGTGINVAIMDDRYYDDYAPLKGQVDFYNDYTPTPGSAEPSTNKLRGHGTIVGTLIAGKPIDTFKGGVAPNANLFYARICADNLCSSTAAHNASKELASKNIRVVNLSLGGVYDTEAKRANAAAAWSYALSPLIQAGALIVASTGNEGATEASFPAATPYIDPKIQGSFVAVGAVEVDADGNPTISTSYSNHCGTAAEWCMVAPGTYTVPALVGTEFLGRVGGTSMSAGAVSGVAALVAQAFPWMSASNLQQTLLTTATDLGAVGVDKVYGWGMVNADKAVQGPGMFNGEFAADVTGTSTFTNNISGGGGLRKFGEGTLNLMGDNTFVGAIELQNGSLGLGGNLASGVIFTGDSHFVALGGKIGGYFTAGDDTTTSIAIGSPLSVGGVATLDGSLLLRSAASTYTVAGTEAVINAGSVVGTFDEVKYANDFFYSAVLKYDATTVKADLTRSSAAAVAMASGSAVAVVDGATQMDALVGALDKRVTTGQTAGIESLLSTAASLMASDNTSAGASMASLTGHVHGVNRMLAVQSSLNDARNAADRLPYLADTFAPTGWVQGEVLDGSVDRNGYASADYDRYAVTVGVDVPVRDTTIVGASLTKARTNATVSESASELDGDSVTVTGYAYQPFADAYLSGVASFTTGDVDTRRMVQAGSISDEIANSRKERAWSVRAEGGLSVTSELSVFAGVGAVGHEQRAFSEQSSTGLGLSAKADRVDLAYADLGLRHRATQGAWTFDSLLAYRNAFSGTETDFNAWFTGLSEATFTVNGQPVSREAIRAMVGVAYAFNPHVTVYGNVTTERAGDVASNASGNLGLRWKF